MNALTTSLKDHHKHCDDLFVDAEAAVAAKNWENARVRVDLFSSVLETHFRTEEEALFPAFEAATGMAGGPTQVMRYEHAQMRDLLDQMRAAGDKRDDGAFAGAAETLLILMQQHNMKEENILYPMCDQTLRAQSDSLAPLLNQRLNATCKIAT